MAATVSWLPDPASNGVTSYFLESSVDSTVSWQAIATIPYNLSGANYSAVTKTFFYTDSAGAPGTIYRISAIGSNGTSDYEYVIVPAGPPPKCRVVGYMENAFSAVDCSSPIHVAAYVGKGQWFNSAPGTIGQNKQSLAVQNWKTVVYPNSAGIWQVDLLQTIYALITIPALNFQWAFQVPAVTGPINIRDIQCLRTADWYSVTGAVENGTGGQLIATGN